MNIPNQNQYFSGFNPHGTKDILAGPCRFCGRPKAVCFDKPCEGLNKKISGILDSVVAQEVVLRGREGHSGGVN